MIGISKREIIQFFARRPFARPFDWPEIKCEAISDERQRELAIWINGYLCAKPPSFSRGNQTMIQLVNEYLPSTFPEESDESPF